MSTPTINTQQVRPALYARSSMPSLNRLQERIAPTVGVTAAAATSTWIFGDRASSPLAVAAGLTAALGTLAVTGGPVVEILNDARDGHTPRDRDLAPAIATVWAALAAATWSGLWIQVGVLLIGSAVVAVLVADLIHAARIQLGKGAEW